MKKRAKRKATKKSGRTQTRTKRKARKSKKKGHIPLRVLEKRLHSLNAKVKARGGRAY